MMLDLPQRLLGGADADSRSRFFNAVRSCRRRPQAPIYSLPISGCITYLRRRLDPCCTPIAVTVTKIVRRSHQSISMAETLLIGWVLSDKFAVSNVLTRNHGKHFLVCWHRSGGCIPAILIHHWPHVQSAGAYFGDSGGSTAGGRRASAGSAATSGGGRADALRAGAQGPAHRRRVRRNGRPQAGLMKETSASYFSPAVLRSFVIIDNRRSRQQRHI